MRNKLATIAAAAAVVAGLLVSTPAYAASISAKGSSFANGMLQACTAAYTTHSVSYTSTGSGTGRTEFAAGNIDCGASDVPYTSGFPTTGKNARYLTIPLFGGPVAFAYSAVGVNDGLNLTPEIISGILKGTITRWDDAAIKTLNPKLKLPKKTIKVAYRASGSGTNSNLTEYLRQTVGGWTASNNMATGAGAGGVVGTSFATSQLLAGYIEDNSNAFGYFDLSDAISADVAIAKLRNAAGAFVAPSSSAAGRFLSAQSIRPASDGDALGGTLNMDFTKVVSGAYQLTIPVYALAPRYTGSERTSTDASKIAVRDFLNYVVKTCVPAKAASLGYVPVGGAVRTAVLKQIALVG